MNKTKINTNMMFAMALNSIMKSQNISTADLRNAAGLNHDKFNKIKKAKAISA